MAASETISGGAAGESILRVVAGTAGHIDHGKSTLVKRLTGIDPDRLPEEKARGLTIDLGFANLKLSNGSRLGIIDVPGHEKFVHNMVAGATGIDFALLVVAADDGVMPQTIEHLEILELLGIGKGAIALTKIDLVAEDLRELVIEDVRETVKGTFLENARIFSVSSANGAGIDELRAGLELLALETAQRSAGGVFRMSIQRVFAAKGFGCVVTGVPVSGTLTIGDKIEVLPARAAGVIRGLEAYHQSVARISSGHSSALNISGIEASSCARGMAVVTPGYFPPTEYITVQLKHLSRRKKPLRDRQILRFHAGTHETGAILTLLDRSELQPGETAFAQLKLDEPFVAGAGDRFLVRIPSPPQTVGGGVVVDVNNRRLRKNRQGVVEDLTEAAAALGDLRAQVLLEIKRAKTETIKLSNLSRNAAALESAVTTIVDGLLQKGECLRLKNGALIHKTAFQQSRKIVEKTIADYFSKNPERLVCDRLALREGSGLDAALLDDLLLDLTKNQRIALEPGGGVRMNQQKSELSGKAQDLRDRVLASLESARFTPPTHDELAAELGCTRSALDTILKRLVDEKKLARISAEYHFAVSSIDIAKAAIVRNCELRTKGAAEGELDLPSLRDELGTTRRWIIPLLEWFDGTGFTTRLGARRIIKKR